AIPTEQNTSKEFSISADPWYNEDWSYRKNVSIEGSVGATTDYQVIVNVSKTDHAETETGFVDVRFTDNDGVTLLDYWMEVYEPANNWDAFAVFWVEVADDLDSNQSIYMYYGNDAVSTTSNGEDTFLFYEDWDSETVDAGRWDVKTSDGSISYAAGGATHGTLATISGNAGTDVWHIESDLHLSVPFATRFRSNLEQTVASNQRTIQGLGSFWGATEPAVLIWNSEGGEGVMYSDDDGNQDLNPTNGSLLGVQTIWES
ncbi:unnamed protein product, partial [marine sediment metagenome]